MRVDFDLLTNEEKFLYHTASIKPLWYKLLIRRFFYKLGFKIIKNEC